MAIQTLSYTFKNSFKIGGYTSDFESKFTFSITSDSTTNKFLVQLDKIEETRKNSWSIGRIYRVGFGTTTAEAEASTKKYWLKQPTETVSGGKVYTTTGGYTDEGHTNWVYYYADNHRWFNGRGDGTFPTLYVYLKMYTAAGSGINSYTIPLLSSTLKNTPPSTTCTLSVNHPQYDTRYYTTTGTGYITVTSESGRTRQYKVGSGVWTNYSSKVSLGCNPDEEDVTVQARARHSAYPDVWVYSEQRTMCRKRPPAPTLSIASTSQGWQPHRLTTNLSISSPDAATNCYLYQNDSWYDSTQISTNKATPTANVSHTITPIVSSEAAVNLKARVIRAANGGMSGLSNAVTVYYGQGTTLIENFSVSEDASTVSFKIKTNWSNTVKGNLYYRVYYTNTNGPRVISDTLAGSNVTEANVSFSNTTIRDGGQWYLLVWGNNVHGVQTVAQGMYFDTYKNTSATWNITGLSNNNATGTLSISPDSGYVVIDGNTYSHGDTLTRPRAATGDIADFSGVCYNQYGVKGLSPSFTVDTSFPTLVSTAVTTYTKNTSSTMYYPGVSFTPSISCNSTFKFYVGDEEKSVSGRCDANSLTSLYNDEVLANSSYERCSLTLTRDSTSGWGTLKNVTVLSSISTTSTIDIPSINLLPPSSSGDVSIEEDGTISGWIQFIRPVNGTVSILYKDSAGNTTLVSSYTLQESVEWRGSDRIVSAVSEVAPILRYEVRYSSGADVPALSEITAESKQLTRGSVYKNTAWYCTAIPEIRTWKTDFSAAVPCVYDGSRWVDCFGNERS